MITGVLLFAIVAHFVLRPNMARAGELPVVVLDGLLGVSIAGCALSLVLRNRVPQRGTEDSTDLFWTTATTPALLTWMPLDAASLLAVFVYARTGWQIAIAVAAVAVVLFVVLNPGYLERR